MDLFLYKVKNDTGRTLVGVLEAKNIKEVKRLFQIQDHFFLSAQTYDRNNLARIQLKLDDLVMFNQRLSYLIDAGVPILQSLRTLWKQSEHPDVQIVVSYIYENLEHGGTLREAFGAFPKAFSPMYLALISVAEVGAGLSNILKKLSQYLEDQKKFYSRMKRATMYPLFVLGFALMVLLGLFVFVVPTFEKVITKLHSELPILTQILFGFSNLIRNPIVLLVLILVIILTIILWKYFSKVEAVKYRIDYWKLKMPLFKDILYPLSVGRFTRSLSLLISSGVPLLTSVEVAQSTIVNKWLQKAVDEIRQFILEGGSLYEAFKATKVFPLIVVEMVGIGEAGGKLQKLLENVSTHLEEEADYALNKFLTFIEPILIIFVGGIVLLVLLGIYLPIFSLQNVLRTM